MEGLGKGIAVAAIWIAAGLAAVFGNCPEAFGAAVAGTFFVGILF